MRGSILLSLPEDDGLTRFMPLISFDTPENIKKGFLFSGGMKRDQWHEMG